MNYKVLYRKYRPSTFDEVVGQDAIQLLKEAVINDKIAHAYIFSGPRGTGKTSTAKIFAKTINCTNPQSGCPCGKCDNCINFSSSNDIYEIDAASHNGVDQVRELIDNIKLTPFSSKYKVYIIDEVHMLTVQAFNAMLLTLEEPPQHVVFILATTDIQKVPITILSRCQRVDFRKISNENIINNIKNVCQKENISIEDSAINEIALFADGGMRDALSILDQLSKLEKNITVDDVLSNIGLVSTQTIDNLIEYVDNKQIDNIIDTVEKIKNTSCDYKTLVRKIVEKYRNLAIQSLKEPNSTYQQFDFYKLMCFDLSSTLTEINVNVNPFDKLELILLDRCKTISISEKDNKKYFPTNKKVMNNEDITDNSIKTVPSVSSNNEVSEKYFPGNNLVNIRINNCFVNAKKKDKDEMVKSYNEFLENLKNKHIKGMLSDSEIVLASQDIAVIKTEYDTSSDVINRSLDTIESTYNKLYNSNIKFIAVDNKLWQEKMEEYKNNIKQKISYEYIEEPLKDEINVDSDIFSKDKIEIK